MLIGIPLFLNYLFQGRGVSFYHVAQRFRDVWALPLPQFHLARHESSGQGFEYPTMCRWYGCLSLDFPHFIIICLNAMILAPSSAGRKDKGPVWGTLAFFKTMKWCRKKSWRITYHRGKKFWISRGGGLGLTQMRNAWNEKQYRVTKTLTSRTLKLPNYQTNRAPGRLQWLSKRKPSNVCFGGTQIQRDYDMTPRSFSWNVSKGFWTLLT